MFCLDWQESTYYYGNAVPQWQSINNGNWKRLESSVREKVSLTLDKSPHINGNG